MIGAARFVVSARICLSCSSQLLKSAIKNPWASSGAFSVANLAVLRRLLLGERCYANTLVFIYSKSGSFLHGSNQNLRLVKRRGIRRLFKQSSSLFYKAVIKTLHLVKKEGYSPPI